MGSKKNKNKTKKENPKVPDKDSKRTIIKALILVLALITVILIFLIFGDFWEESEKIDLKNFNECLFENGMRIYGMQWCPSCNQLVEMLGGSEKAGSLYIECSEPVNQRRCELEMITGSVPEIQVNEEVYYGERSLEGFANVTGCHLYSENEV